MKIVKRTKGKAIHYVAKIDPRGSITELTPDKAKAAGLTDGQLEAMEKFHKNKPEAGKFSVEVVGPEPRAVFVEEKTKEPEKPKDKTEVRAPAPPAPPIPPAPAG